MEDRSHFKISTENGIDTGLGIAYVLMNKKDLAKEEYETIKKVNEGMAGNLLDYINKAEEQLKSQNQPSGPAK